MYNTINCSIEREYAKLNDNNIHEYYIVLFYRRMYTSRCCES